MSLREKNIDYARVEYLEAAIGAISDLWDVEGKNPGSDQRGMDTQLVDLVIQRWVKLTGMDTCDFPFTDNFVEECWIAYRKLPETAKETSRIQRNDGVTGGGP